MRRLGRYELMDELGRGGASVVYLALDTATDRQVALKVLAPHLPRQGDLLARFQREIKLAVQLEHPHIVPIFDVGVEGDQPYIVLRLLTGGSLADRIEQGPMGVRSALAVLKQVASALDAAHRLKIIHRDVKPSNILFDQNGSAYLSDFGIAKAIDAVATPVTSWAVGTPAFMSPEQLRGQAIDARTDEYALGIVTFVMLTGRLPYEGTTAHVITQQLIEQLPDIQRFNPQLPVSIQAVLERATAKDPALRFASAGEFVFALDSAAQAWAALDETTPELDAADLAPARAQLPAEPGPGAPAPDGAARPPPAPYEVLSINPDLGPPGARSAFDADVAARAPEARPPARVARRWPWLLALAGLSLAIALILWQLGAFAGFAGVTPTPTSGGATELASTQNAAIMLTTVASTTGSPLTVTLAPDAIALAIITLPTGTASAALRTSPTGETIQTLPDRTIVQVLAGRQRLPDDSVWVAVRAPNGETGWVAEALLTYFNSPTAVLTPEGATSTSLTPGPAATSGPRTPTIQPRTTNSPTGAPAASAQPGSTGISPGAAPTRTAPPAQPPTNTVPPTTNIPAPSSTPAPTKLPRDTLTPLGHPGGLLFGPIIHAAQ